MKIKLSIDGVYIVKLAQIVNEGGTLMHMLRSDAADFTRFGECYFSEVLPGTIKAWKLHPKQTQNLAVPIGQISLVIYDDRNNSITRGNLEVLQLGRPDSYSRVCIPPNLWYGFTCMSDSPALLVNCSDLPHDPSDSKVIDVNDKKIPYSWPNNIWNSSN